MKKEKKYKLCTTEDHQEKKLERSLAHEVYLLLNFQIFFTFKQDIADNDIPMPIVQILITQHKNIGL